MTNSQRRKREREENEEKIEELEEDQYQVKQEPLEDIPYTEPSQYEVEQPPQQIYQESGDGFVDSKDEIEQSLYNFKQKVEIPESRLTDGDNVPDNRDSDNVQDPGSSKTKAGQAFGFIRNKFDDATDTFKVRKAAKERAYEKYLEERPRVLQEAYEKQYKEKLMREAGYKPGQDKFITTLGTISEGSRKIGAFLGGTKNPDQVTGLRGTVLGPLPGPRIPGIPGEKRPVDIASKTGLTGTKYGEFPKQSFGSPDPRQQMQSRRENIQPVKYQEPGVVGSQVPLYQSAPKTSQPGVTWQRVVKTDSTGKKRSYMRKARIPDMQPRPDIQMKTQQQIGNMQQQENPLYRESIQPTVVGGINVENLSRLSRSPETNKTFGEKVLSFMGKSRSNLNPELQRSFKDKVENYVGIKKKNLNLERFI